MQAAAEVVRKVRLEGFMSGLEFIECKGKMGQVCF
jgi:hypothetical protein